MPTSCRRTGKSVSARPMDGIASFNRMSPDQVPERNGSWGTEIDRTLGDIGTAAIRMSPNLGSPWSGPGTPSGWPPSAVSAKLMSALTAHVWKARRISACQAGGDCSPSSVRKRSLVAPATWVPSGTKLMVKWSA